jgi:hypothetical protein
MIDMRKLKITPSLLNSFNRFQDEYFEWDTEEKFVDGIVGGFQSNEKMVYGSACHKYIEDPDKYALHNGLFWVPNEKRYREKFGDYTKITGKEAFPLKQWHDQHPETVYEVPFRQVYHINDDLVTLSMKVDNLSEDTVTDFKITDAQQKADDYMKSYQWRSYLAGMGLPNFVYQIWQRKGRQGDKELVDIFEGGLKVYWYDGIVNDVIEMMERLISYLDQKDLISYIEIKEQ